MPTRAVLLISTNKENYLRAFTRMLKVREEKGLETTWKSAEEVFNWWINL